MMVGRRLSSVPNPSEAQIACFPAVVLWSLARFQAVDCRPCSLTKEGFPGGRSFTSP